MDRQELAGFLRGRREHITPADVGLPAGPRRRTPGLRREEVAQLAFISTEYYTRLEQARGPRPSREVLAGLARALRLSDAERDHLHHLAGAPSSPPAGPSHEVPQSILDLLRRLPHTAAIVLSATYEVIAWNDLAAALLEDFSPLPRRERNLVRRAYLAPRSRERPLYDPFDAEAFARAAVRRLRAAAARYPDDREVATLVDDLLAGSAEFARLWAAHDVRPEPTLLKTVDHPLIGPIALNCTFLDIAGLDQQIVLFTVEPGSPAQEALRLLSVIGTQRMDVSG
ncbi:helix-turn-helix transcriptional regulator [Streptomyces sp. NPDC057433]|uniref:helix-turn-helix transcriptional regulator n=1 Tax=Streptomyces sp. NPDC057433 TaxID=3346132 RepID=UPI0036A19DE8